MRTELTEKQTQWKETPSWVRRRSRACLFFLFSMARLHRSLLSLILSHHFVVKLYHFACAVLYLFIFASRLPMFDKVRTSLTSFCLSVIDRSIQLFGSSCWQINKTGLERWTKGCTHCSRTRKNSMFCSMGNHRNFFLEIWFSMLNTPEEKEHPISFWCSQEQEKYHGMLHLSGVLNKDQLSWAKITHKKQLF